MHHATVRRGGRRRRDRLWRTLLAIRPVAHRVSGRCAVLRGHPCAFDRLRCGRKLLHERWLGDNRCHGRRKNHGQQCTEQGSRHDRLHRRCSTKSRRMSSPALKNNPKNRRGGKLANPCYRRPPLGNFALVRALVMSHGNCPTDRWRMSHKSSRFASDGSLLSTRTETLASELLPVKGRLAGRVKDR